MKQRRATAKAKGFRFKFIGETIAELKKVVWLSRQEVAYLTVLVIVIAVMVGLVLGIIDYGFTRLVNDVFLGS
ncbi:MAG: preprotein translocase subunit SecE [Dehalococcoidales bacterium]|nr:preprotein translocase subunit SecE [Dehalococcoidales bacterium]MDZ4230370.1 preprotein translocase subunit SecE [Dehalococcoidales bacterium]